MKEKPIQDGYRDKTDRKSSPKHQTQSFATWVRTYPYA